MTPEEALDIVTRATGELKLTRAAHQAITLALEVLDKLVKENAQ